jgi:hypothetical protein
MTKSKPTIGSPIQQRKSKQNILQQKKEQIWKRRTEKQFMEAKEKLKKYI